MCQRPCPTHKFRLGKPFDGTGIFTTLACTYTYSRLPAGTQSGVQQPFPALPCSTSRHRVSRYSLDARYRMALDASVPVAGSSNVSPNI